MMRHTPIPVLDEREFLDRYGEVMCGRDLCRALGYGSAKSLRRAQQNGLLPTIVFELPNRRGRYALTRDVVAWLQRCRDSAEEAVVAGMSTPHEEDRAMS